MIKQSFTRSKISVLIAACLTAGATPAFADDNSGQMQQMQQQIQTLEQRLEQMQAQQQKDQQVQQATQQKIDQTSAPAQVVPQGYLGNNPGNMQGNQTAFRLGGVNVQLGGFLASETAYRSRSLQSDIGSPFNQIPFAPANPGSVNAMSNRYNQSEFRGTERQSRFSLLVDGNVDPDTIISGYYELDFLGAAPTANANESNSYQPRTRHVYANIDWMASGWHVLAGQTWSLATLNTHGITPRMEEIPLTIDAQYVPGFTWARQWQFRVVKDWDKKWWAAISFENSQNNGVTGTADGTTNVYQATPPGGSLFAGAPMSVNHYPDIIAKLASESDLGHYEIYDLARNFQSVYGASTAPVQGVAPGSQQSTWSNAVGVGAVIPLVPKQLELSFSGLFGNGIGRYGTSGLPDADFNPNGSLNPLKGSQMLGGLIWHTNPTLDIYGNIGQEQIDSNTYSAGGATYGYGNNISNTSVNQYSPFLNKVSQETVGFWWSFYKGSYGAAKLGGQFSHTLVTGFQTAAAGVTPTSTDNMVFTSLRYFPF
ncbi:MAG: hypothetical protein ACYC0M_04395 [Burkholderiales bacterium]